jgi:hypothetical protein
MENNPLHHGHEEGACCGGICKCCKHPVVRIIIKIVLILVILGLICMAFFKCHHNRFDRDMKFGGYGMMTTQAIPAGTAVPAFGMMGFEKGGSWGEEKEGKGMTRLFGVITKIDGNKITILDNGAKEQTFLSQPATTIMTATGEVGLSALKAGQNVILLQEKGEDKKLELKLVQVL